MVKEKNQLLEVVLYLHPYTDSIMNPHLHIHTQIKK